MPPNHLPVQKVGLASSYEERESKTKMETILSEFACHVTILVFLPI